jgi:hypothetical protein
MRSPGQLIVCQERVVEMQESLSESSRAKDFLTTGGGGGGHLALVRLGDLSSYLTLFIVARMV